MKHSYNSLSGWTQLTTGVPAALSEPELHRNLGNYLALMQGCETGIIAPSTLHLYFDLFDLLCKQNITVFIDEKIYPISTYSIEKLILNGIPIYLFKHFDACHLNKLMSDKIIRHTIPVVLTDGFCPQCGKPAPVKKYLSLLQSFNGRLIIDDTQAFGILGKRKGNFIYGYGGGGILQWNNISADNIITIVSLAKAFGVPMAVVSGSKSFIKAFEKNSKTRESSSPVSFAHVNAAYHAMNSNKKFGDERRKKLFRNISALKQELSQLGVRLVGGFFPIQSIVNINSLQTDKLFETLKDKGFATAMIYNHKERKPVVCIIVNYEHSIQDIFSLTRVIKQLCNERTKIFS